MTITQAENFPAATLATRTRHFTPTDMVADAPDSSLSVPDGFFRGRSNLSVEVGFAGSGANNTTIEYEIYGIQAIGNLEEGGHFQPVLLGEGTATLSELTGVEDAIVADTLRIADTVTFTADDYLTYVEAFRSKDHAVYSPADDDEMALVGIPDFNGLVGFVFRRTGGSATNPTALVSVST